jgi:dipicolinate synthase subunit A
MIDGNSFGIIGGDSRQIALADSIASDGFTVLADGFENIDFANQVKKAGLEEIVENCENIVLPLPVTADGIHVRMDYSEENIVLDDAFAALMRGKEVFGGMMGKLYQTSEIWATVNTYDYYTREEFAIRNAVPTAEGAIGIAMQEFPGTVNGSRCLVVGFGRVGKMLAWMLHGIGAKVTASARRQSDIAWIESYGYESVLTEQVCEGESYDVIFNTVPAVIFNRRILSRMKGKPLLIDLASPPGGVDFATAEKIGIKTIHALSLPGKVAPKAAGEIMKNTIYNILEE